MDEQILGISIVSRQTAEKLFSAQDEHWEGALESSMLRLSMRQQRDFPQAEYVTVVGPKLKGALFVTNRRVNQVLNALAQRHPEILRGKKIGWIALTVDRNNRVLYARDYYPLGTHGGEISAREEIGLALLKSGIASQIDSVLSRRWMQRFPGRNFSITKNASPSRKEQVRGRGIDPNKPLPIEEFHQRTKNYLINKARAKRHLK